MVGRQSCSRRRTNQRNLSEFELVKTSLSYAEEPMLKKACKPRASQAKTVSTKQPVDEYYLVRLPLEIQPFVNEIEDVKTDGHCGYWVVAKQLKLLTKNVEAPWRYVRQKMVKNLKKMRLFYQSMWDVKGFKDIMENVDFPISGVDMDVKYWMTLPEAGFLIAETFTTVVVIYNKHGSNTFVPNHVKPSTRTKGRIIFMGFVDGSHFVSLHMEPNAPIAPYPSVDVNG
ncbi:uncharacterized protein LOC113279277 [Papaver somniferum]|uniref:uncharacterized protein LOC113279277 n=1 Tax=Papaver somniferum TaxID=3469 RepID=UPI000E6F798A|nr:uncharacterized protein LOC113279277 [Papaver somniferum]